MLIFIIALLASIFMAACTALQPIALQNMVNACTTGDLSAVTPHFLFFVSTIVGILVFEFIRQLSVAKYGANKTVSLKHRLLNRLLTMSLKDFRLERGQNYVTILNQEVDMVVEKYHQQILELSYSVLVLLSSAAALFYISPLLAVLILFFTFLPILASSLQGKRMQKRTDFYTQSLERLNVMIGNLISGFPTLKVNGAEGRYSAVLNQGNESAARADFDAKKTQTFINFSSAFPSYLGNIAMIGVSVFLISRGELTVGALLGVLQIFEMLSIPVVNISYQLNDMNGVKGVRKKLETMLAPTEKVCVQGRACPPITEIEFKNVSFRYQDKYVLKDINLRFDAGKKYLIIGENGSGKSTLFKLMSKFETDYEGQVLVNGIDLRELDNSFFHQVGIILQNAFLLNDTFYHNLTFYDDCSVEAVKETLLSLGMGEFLATHDLSEEYHDTKDNLSGGEKQKLSLARILLQDKRFILMDEATSAIDAESSRQIEERLLHAENITLINIEHKIIPELIPLYDEILELKDGSVIKKQGRDGNEL